jgi:hypothetical protein
MTWILYIDRYTELVHQVPGSTFKNIDVKVPPANHQIVEQAARPLVAAVRADPGIEIRGRETTSEAGVWESS